MAGTVQQVDAASHTLCGVIGNGAAFHVEIGIGGHIDTASLGRGCVLLNDAALQGQLGLGAGQGCTAELCGVAADEAAFDGDLGFRRDSENAAALAVVCVVIADLGGNDRQLALFTGSHATAALVSAGRGVIGDDGAIQGSRCCAGQPQTAAFLAGAVAGDGHSADLINTLVQRNATALGCRVAGDQAAGEGAVLEGIDAAAVVIGYVVSDHAAFHPENAVVVNTAAVGTGGIDCLIAGNLAAVHIEGTHIVDTCSSRGSIAADLAAPEDKGGACVDIDRTGGAEIRTGDGTGNVVALFVGIGGAILQRQDSAAVLGQLDGTTAGGCHDIMAVEAQIGGLAEGCHLGQLHILGQVEVAAAYGDLRAAGDGGIRHTVVIVACHQLRSCHDAVLVGIRPADALTCQGHPAAVPCGLVFDIQCHSGVGALGSHIDAAALSQTIQLQHDGRIVHMQIPAVGTGLVGIVINDDTTGKGSLALCTGHVHTTGVAAGGGVAGDLGVLHI